MSTRTYRLSRSAHLGATALSLALAAGGAASIARGAIFTYSPQCSSLLWTSSCSTPNGCGAGNPLFRNNWGLTECTNAPALPGAADDVVIPVSGGTANGNQSLRSLVVNAGVGLALQANLTVSVGLTNSGSVSTSGAGNLSYIGSFTNAAGGSWIENSNGRFFTGCAFSNAGLLELQTISLQNNGGTNSITNTGTIRKTGTGPALMNFPLTNNASVDVQAGSFSVNSTSYTGGPSSTINVASGAEFNLNSNTVAGRINGTGAGEITSTGTLTASGAVVANVASNLRVASNITVPAGSSFTNTNRVTTSGAGNVSYAGSFTNASGATWIENSNARFYTGATFANAGLLELQSIALADNGGTNSLTNTGTIRKTGVATATVNFPVNNSGLIEVQAGTLGLSGSSYTAAPAANLSVATGATCTLTNMTLAGTVNFSGAGTLQSTSNLSVSGAVALNTSSPFRLLSNVTVGAGNSLTNSGSLSTSGAGNISYTGPIVNGATGTWLDESNTRLFTGASFTNNGLWQLRTVDLQANGGANAIINNGTMRMAVPSTSASINVPVTNNALLDMQAGTLTLSGTTYTGSTPANIAVASGATVNFSNMTLAGIVQCSGAGTLRTTGTLTVAGNVTTNTSSALRVLSSVTVTSGNSLVNQGQLSTSAAGNINYVGPLVNGANGTWIENSNGRFFANSSFVNNGTFEVQSVSLVDNGGTNTLTNNATMRKTGTSSSSVNFPFTNNAALNVLDGTFQVSGTSYTGSGASSVAVSAPGTLSLSNVALVGTLRTTGTGVVQALSNFSASGAAVVNTQQSFRVVSNLSASGVGNSLTNRGTLSTSGAGNLNYAGSFVNASGATWIEESNGRFFASASLVNEGTLELRTVSLISNGGTNSITNNSTLRKTGSGSASTSVQIFNTGLTSVEAGTLSLTGGYTQASSSARTRVLSGATLSGSPLSLTGGSVEGRGTISQALSLTGGTLNPGDPTTQGTLTLGGLSMGPSSTMQVDIAAVSNVPFDRALVTGNVSLSGPLVINLVSPFYPVLGDVYEIVRTTGGTRTGTFSSVTLNADPGIAVSVSYTPTTVLVTVTETTCDQIDFNRDGLFPDDTDLIDLLSVLAGGPCSSDPAPGCSDVDFNNDGLFPDDSDLVSFLRVLAGGSCD
jgi:hypothetical protein